MNSKAFTLIELLVVISILGLLSSLVLIGLQGAKDQAEIAKAQEFSHTIRVTMGADLIGEWRFDNNTNDSSGYDNDGTMIGTPTQVDGIFNQAMEFDGSGESIEVQYDIVDTTEPFTVSAWARPNEYKTAAWEVRIATDRNTANAFTLYQNNDSIHFAVWNDSETVFGLTASNVLEIGKWTYAVGVFNGTDTISFYVNGDLIDSRDDITGTLRDNVGTFYIGGTSSIPDRSFNGAIDEVQVYSKALTTAEIQQLYAQGAEKHNIVLK